MTDNQQQDEGISLAQAARELHGRATYKQLYLAVLSGRLPAAQPYGKKGHYRVLRHDLERLLQPVRREKN